MTYFNDVSKTFWKSQKKYPDYGVSKTRRWYELAYLVPQLKVNSILDLGCGDGSLLRCLLEMTDIETFYGYDLSASLLKHVDKRVKTKVYDCLTPTELPETDITIMAGLIQCIEKDEDVRALLSQVRSKAIFIRSACHPEDVLITKYSKTLKNNYASNYRSGSHVVSLIEPLFKVEEVRRVYPDEIESRFGSRQYYFKATRK